MKKIPCEIYSRVVGYFRPVSQWNKGKKEEFNDRKYLKIGGTRYDDGAGSDQHDKADNR